MYRLRSAYQTYLCGTVQLFTHLEMRLHETLELAWGNPFL